MARMLRYQGYCWQTIEVDLDTRANPMHVQGSIIMSAGVAVGLPLVVEAEIRPDGEIVTRCYEWARGYQPNPYWHVAEITQDDVRRRWLVLTEAQRATIWRLWAAKHPYREIHDNGVGATLLRITGQSLDEAAARYLGGQVPALSSVTLADGTIIGEEDDDPAEDERVARQEAALELACEDGILPGAMSADL
jgi:hypothetical protein